VLIVADRHAGRGLTTLRGRASECERFDRLLAGVRAGRSGVLVVRGEAGVGKTALLQYLVESAPDLRVMRVVGVESEMELAFGALHQLCAPMLDQLGRLPGPQHDALATVFGLSQGAVPDRFLVGLAVLSLLSHVAEERPLVCVVDDAQWLDRASAQALGFAARRLLAEPIALVMAARELGKEFQGLPELEVQGLRNGDARELLGSVVLWRLDTRVQDQIVAETRGNPLALLELPRGLSAAQLAGGFGLIPALSLSGRIEESFRLRIEGLPTQTRLLMLIAAADPTADPGLVWRAAGRLGVTGEALAPAAVAGLLEIGVRVRFRHPLVRSAVYLAAPQSERQMVHGALAEVTDPETDPDRRAWHHAQATSGPDEEVAAELEVCADRARARGGLVAAAAFLDRSASLTVDPARRVQRMLVAAQFNVQAGAFDAALGLLAAAEAAVPDEFGYARVDLLRARVASASGAGSEAPAELLRAARRLEPLDVTLARETYLDAWGAALFAGRLASAGNLLEVSQAARVAPPPIHPPGPPDLLLNGLAVLITEGRGAAAPMLMRAVSAFRGEEVSVEKGLQWAVMASSAAVTLWDFESWDAVITRQVELARSAGALAQLAIALNGRGIVVTWRGDFAAAAPVVAEAAAVTEATETRIAPYGAMLLAAYRGREAEASAMIEATINDAVAGGEGLGVQYARWVTAILYNGLGRYEDALDGAWQASEDTPELFLYAWALVELIEAAFMSGKAGLAADALERFAETTAASDSDWGAGVKARSRALLSEGEAAEALYREAIDRLSRTRLRPELARAHLLYGEWLSRRNRRMDARQQLRGAYDMFVSMGADGFADRARHELLATGETVRKRRQDTREELTPQEELIARLARDGRTNLEIGAELYLSSRTVEWHLGHVFTKLGISSRRGLRAALPPQS
jgi:DNA-binding CsgD family transcriptional regulator/tetratricopeptide (TPR) repeat protein